MTAVTYPAVQCDGPGPDGKDCYAEIHHTMARAVGDVRHLCREDGWRQRPGGRDLCPDCWSAGHR